MINDMDRLQAHLILMHDEAKKSYKDSLEDLARNAKRKLTLLSESRISFGSVASTSDRLTHLTARLHSLSELLEIIDELHEASEDKQ